MNSSTFKPRCWWTEGPGRMVVVCQLFEKNLSPTSYFLAGYMIYESEMSVVQLAKRLIYYFKFGY